MALAGARKEASPPTGDRPPFVDYFPSFSGETAPPPPAEELPQPEASFPPAFATTGVGFGLAEFSDLGVPSVHAPLAPES